MRRLLFDIEADDLLENVTTVHCIVVCDVDTEGISVFRPGEIVQALCLLESADVLIGHNIQEYDLRVLHKLHRFHSGATIRDTFVLSPLVWSDLKDIDHKMVARIPELSGMRGKHSLKAWGARLGVPKANYEGGFAQFSEEMLEYCIQDVRTNLALWRKMEPKLPPDDCVEQEHAFASAMRRVEENGVCFDTSAAGRLQGKLAQEREAVWRQLDSTLNREVALKRKRIDGRFTTVAEAYCPELDVSYVTPKTGKARVKHRTFSANSRDHIATFFQKKYGWEPEVWTNGGKPSVDEKVLSKLAYPEAQLLARALLIQKRLGQLAEGPQALLQRVRADGRIHGRIHHNGTLTGRCAHTSPNLGQVPRVTAPWGLEFRACFVAPPGYRLVGADASGLELRMLAHYLARYDGGTYRDALLEGDIHSATQQWAGLETRDQAKTFTYATLYGAGDNKIGSIVGGAAKEGAALKRRFYRAVPAFPRLLENLTAAWIKHGQIRGLDGRPLRPRKKNSLLNTLLQSAGAVVMKRATLNALSAIAQHRLDARLVLHVHDEFQFEVLESHTEPVGQQLVHAIEAAGEHFKLRCPTTGEYKIGNTWAETH